MSDEDKLKMTEAKVSLSAEAQVEMVEVTIVISDTNLLEILNQLRESVKKGNDRPET
jgi:hypothetical protein